MRVQPTSVGCCPKCYESMPLIAGKRSLCPNPFPFPERARALFLHRNPKKRATAAELLKHPFLQGPEN